MDANFLNRLRTSKQSYLAPRSPLPAPRRAFTLVELLVVITIIGILASLITVAAVGALKTARRTQIKAEINEIAGGFDEYKNKTTAYPPNCQTDDDSTASAEPTTTPIAEAEVLNDLRRHIQQIAPRSQESDELAKALVGLPSSIARLERGISADEAVVFWLGGFSSDPKYPISGDGGPSYAIAAIGDTTNASKDPIESRTWVYPFDVTRLGPRDSNGYFSGRAIEYTAPNGQLRRINFWQYYPSKSDQPFVYFDTSRHPVGKVSGSNLIGYYDPPAATYSNAGDLGSVYAFKKKSETYASGQAVPAIQFINPDKFQVFHCGIDNAWGTDGFQGMAPKVNPKVVNSNNPSDYLLFPTGPYVGDFADTEVNFATETTIEDAVK